MSAEWDKMQDSIKASDDARMVVSLAAIAATNKKIFERECAAAGVDPARGTSPALLKMLGRNIRPPKGEF
jgi:hypothetical protein